MSKRLSSPISSPQQIEFARKRLAKAVLSVYQLAPKPPQQASKGWRSPDFIWRELLLSFSTWGGTRGAGLVTDKKLYGRVTYAALERLTPTKREKILRDTLRDAKVRRYSIKTGLLLKNFDRVKAAGGPAKVKQQLTLCDGRDAKSKFLKSFHGIGDKYARNLMMDVCHPDFSESIALDVRVNKFLKALGVVAFLPGYRQKESFLVSAAHEADLNGWQLDRMLFNHTECLLAALDKT